MSKATDAIRSWNRKYRANFVAVPPDVLAKALSEVDSAENAELSFCPRCGCTSFYSTENMAVYPERWAKTTCNNCGFLIMEVDNSTPQHCFDYKESGYVVEI